MSSVRGLLSIYSRAALRYPWHLVLVLVGVLGMQLANIITPLYVRQLFNIISHTTPTPELTSQLFGIIGAFALWWGVYWVANRLEHFTAVYLVSRVMADITRQAFEYLLKHSYNFFISNFAGSLTHKVNTFSRSFQTIYEVFFLTFLPTILFIIGAVIVLFLQYHLLGVVLAIWVVCFILFQIWVTSLRQPVRRLRSDADTKVTATVADAIGNHSTITLFAKTGYEQERLGDAVEVWRKAGVRSWLTDGYIWSGVGIFMMGIEIGLLYLAVILWSKNLITVGDFVLIQTYLFTLFARLVALQNDLRRFFDAFATGGEMVEILQAPHDIRNIPGAKVLSISHGIIAFKDVSFYFHKETAILKEFNLSIQAGEKVALVGPSGAGKSTITKLLLRLYDVEKGSIEIDGQNIAQVTQDSLRNSIAFVPQEPILFHRSLIENIRYGRMDATDEEVIEAAKKAHCHEFITSLPQAYETFVGERGIKLSGGERQRVAIARAILKDAPILILDEATSSLDSESELYIQDALEVLMQSKTVIVIAHRLSTIMKMDRIVVLEGGKIAAEGSHAELLAQDGLYQKLWSIQAGGFLKDEEPEEEAEMQQG